MLALSLPNMPRSVAALFIAGGGLAIMLAAIRTDNSWERLFASGLGLDTLWGAYFTAVGISPLAYHTFVYFVFSSGALGLLIAAAFVATDSAKRVTAIGFGLTVALEWWEAVQALACGAVVRTLGCSDRFFNLAQRDVPDEILLLVALASIALLVRAAIGVAVQPPSPWVPAALAAGLLFTLYTSFRATIGSVSFDRLTWSVAALSVAGLIALGLAAANDRARPSNRSLGAGIALAAVPGLWNWLDLLLTGSPIG